MANYWCEPLGASDQDYADGDECGSDKVDNDRLASEFLTAELGPNEGKNNTHEENNDWGGRICNGRSDGGRRSERECDAISSVGSDAKNEIEREWAEDTFVLLDDATVVAKPFAIRVDDDEIHDTFADKEQSEW